ncbi:hypothetical protein F5Y16DRAFT_339806 [Xylariaceae sp. FL0255]|nr:hypothetical protein F5Y16DRAFT_339806 [Xylariaceae sp. FL0255]
MNRRQFISLEASRNETLGSHSFALPRQHSNPFSHYSSKSHRRKFTMDSEAAPSGRFAAIGGYLERLLPATTKYDQLDENIDPAAAQERWLKMYYFARVGFSVVWVAAAFTIGKAYPVVADVLLVIYPLWDALANIVDAQRSGGLAVNGTQAVNVLVSTATTVLVIVALVLFDMHWVLGVYGAWAILSGLMQLATGLRRWKTTGAQWAMILSGAQSSLAGSLFIFRATREKVPSVVDIAGYAAFGAFYFLVSALWLTVKGFRDARKKKAAVDEEEDF